jgi:hypothetical protein
MALQVKRGTTAERLSYTPLVGELIFDTTTKALYVGDGAASGGIAASALTFEDVQDYAAALLTGGSHTGISFSYNDSAGTISATVTASGGTGSGTLQVAGDDSVIRVISEGETLQIVGGGGMFVSTNSEGKFTISPPGSYSSLSINDLQTDILRTTDSSSINVTSPIIFNTLVTAEDDLRVNKQLTVGSFTDGSVSDESTIDLVRTKFATGFNFATFRMYTNDDNGGWLTMAKSRGTPSLPLPVQTGDTIGALTWTAYDGSSFTRAGSINIDVASSPSSGSVPSVMKFVTHNGVSRATRVEITSTSTANTTLKVNNISGYTRGWMGIDSVPRLPVYADDTAANTAIGLGNLTNGMIYYDSTLHQFKGRANGAWVALN